MSAPRRPAVLVVDDDPALLRGVARTLRRVDCEVLTTESPSEALAIAVEHDPAVVISDERMPEMRGTELLQRLSEIAPLAERMMLTGEGAQAAVRAINQSGVQAFLEKPCPPDVLIDHVEAALARAIDRRESHRRLNVLTETNRRLIDRDLRARERIESFREELDAISESRQANERDILFNLAVAAEKKDRTTGDHLKRMQAYSRAIAVELGLPGSEVELIYFVAAMHDVGKLGIPDAILQKPGALTDDEWRVMRDHTRLGAQILGKGDTALLAASRTVALSHHERWDGKGYPLGLAGDEIPLHGRIVAVADAFDAITSERPYKPAVPWDEALAEIVRSAGSHFDPEVAEAFRRAYDDLPRA